MIRATGDGGSRASARTACALNKRRPSTESSQPAPLAQLDLVFISFPCSATGCLANLADLREHTLGSHRMEHRNGKEVAHLNAPSKMGTRTINICPDSVP